jgi:hypothetical protein
MITENCPGSRVIAAMAARAVMRGRHLEALRATELGKQFPPPEIVVYNERFHLGSCMN